jgi:hypothetical protein
MPHILSHSSTDGPNPVYKHKKNSVKNKQTDYHKEKKIPMTYGNVKNAATGSGNDTVRFKKYFVCALTVHKAIWLKQVLTE